MSTVETTNTTLLGHLDRYRFVLTFEDGTAIILSKIESVIQLIVSCPEYLYDIIFVES